MAHDKTPKTNAARLLDRLGIAYTLHHVEVDESDLSATTVAARLGVEPARVFKTLVARADGPGVVMACIPAPAELSPKALAAASGSRHAAMVPLAEVRPLTGYVRGGCSPLGAKKAYPVFMDESAHRWERIFISAGQRGVQLELAPGDLARACGAVFADLTRG
ncbi:MAG: Cys-tRNA(Pro) deacylase [Desulfovibrio sp.]|nr:Cys-tRNA(Pro) deacylase [Desulfovibrio sp.]